MKLEANLSEDFILITGRTREQGEGLHKGKESEEYRVAVALVEMNPEDMTRLSIKEGQVVRLRTTLDQVEVPVRTGTLPSGMLFMPMGPVANQLIAAETEGTGMPAFKGLTVKMELT
ncbi:MAG: molybdopterin dinucleotide binding domain-containing protein [Smithellaceae bacterium]|nr:molybdopterin dinucleotide binding domain-containing protein [Smithellaceae bacterium]